MKRNDWVTVTIGKNGNSTVLSGYIKLVAESYFVLTHGNKNIPVFLADLLEFKIIEPYPYSEGKNAKA